MGDAVAIRMPISILTQARATPYPKLYKRLMR